jgi:nicotinamidase/pyrazinamidase
MNGLHAALLVVDAQVDFFPGGALPVPEGDTILPSLNAYLRMFARAGCLVIASRDWHPPETTHFEKHGGPWPVHCVQGTEGAEFHEGLQLPDDVRVVSKGMGAGEDGYSAFQARDDQGTMLAELLSAKDVERLYVCGLALDYCVKASAIDALRHGLDTVVLVDATRAVNVSVHDAEDAVEQLVRAGVGLAVLDQVRATLSA